MKQKASRKTLFLAALPVITGILALSTPVFADYSIHDQAPEDGTSESSNDSSETSQHDSRANSARDSVEHKLSSVKLKSCEVHENVINRIMGRISDRGQRRLNVYTTIAGRVEDFYAKSGKTLGNYDSLVSEVNAKKDSAQAAVDMVKADKVDFKCDGSDPKGVASSFKSDLKIELEALHGYRLAIKDLIVGVKSVQGDNGGDQ